MKIAVKDASNLGSSLNKKLVAVPLLQKQKKKGKKGKAILPGSKKKCPRGGGRN